MNNKATKIANAFSAILREWLSAEEMAELNERNRGYIEANSPMCDSHDYCDPNQAMIDAYEKVIGEEWSSADECGDLCSAAWDIAKRAGFNPVDEGSAE